MTKRDVSGRGGFTLIEILAVVMILTVVAVMAVTRVGTLGARAKTVAAEADLAAIGAAILDGESGYVRDLGGIPGFHPSEMRLANLLIATNLYGLTETAADAAATAAAADTATGMKTTKANRKEKRGAWRICHAPLFSVIPYFAFASTGFGSEPARSSTAIASLASSGGSSFWTAFAFRKVV